MGGKIWVESEYGHGSRFIFELELKEVQVEYNNEDIELKDKTLKTKLKRDINLLKNCKILSLQKIMR